MVTIILSLNVVQLNACNNDGYADHIISNCSVLNEPLLEFNLNVISYTAVGTSAKFELIFI